MNAFMVLSIVTGGLGATIEYSRAWESLDLTLHGFIVFEVIESHSHEIVVPLWSV